MSSHGTPPVNARRHRAAIVVRFVVVGVVRRDVRCIAGAAHGEGSSALAARSRQRDLGDRDDGRRAAVVAFERDRLAAGEGSGEVA